MRLLTGQGLKGLDEPAFRKRMAEVEKMLNHYLETGQMLK